MSRFRAQLERHRQVVCAVVRAGRRHVKHVLPTPLTCCSMGAAHRVGNPHSRWPRDTYTRRWTVGGVISGYWATGSTKRDTMPAIVITIDSTAAKIGRSMKRNETTSLILP